MDSIHFYETHIFPYSKREGTKAAVMPDQLPEQIKKERSRVLIALGQEHQREYMEQFLGKKKEVLFEEQQKIQGQSLTGRGIRWNTIESCGNIRRKSGK